MPPDASVLHLKIVFDTNAIFSTAGGRLVSYDAEKLIREAQGDAHLSVTWYLPQVVVDERRYQLQQEAVQLRGQLKKLENVLRHQFGINEQFINDRIDASIAKQLQDNGLKICQSDPAEIDWARVVRDAVTRTPPFDPDPQMEKGFRDALILEALKQLVVRTADLGPYRLAFVTRDGLLAKATREANLPRVHVLESVDAVRGLINVLLSTKLAPDTVTAWQTTAEKYFFDRETRAGLFADLGVAARIRKDCHDVLAELPPGADRRDNEWKWLVAGPNFVKKMHERVWWANRVKIRSQAFATPTSPQYLESVSGWKPDDAWVISGEPQTNVTLSQPLTLPVGQSVFLPPGNSINVSSSMIGTITSSPLLTSGWATNSLVLPQASSLVVPQANNVTVVLPARQLVATGVTSVVVTWSAAVDQDGTFAEPQIESIEPSVTEWRDP